MKEKILTYLNTLNHPDLDSLPNKYSIITQIYHKLDNLCEIGYTPKKSIFDIYQGAICNLEFDGILVSDVNILSITRFYPSILKYLMENGEEKDAYYYLVLYYDYLKENINDKILFKILINYKYGVISKTDYSLCVKITRISRDIMQELLNNDICKDIIYVDSDTIYYKTKDYEKTIINKLKEYNLSYEIERNKIIYFIAKKKYIILDSFKIKGVKESNMYVNKEISNIAYLLSDRTLEFRVIHRNIDLMIKAKNIYNRKKKLDRIL